MTTKARGYNAQRAASAANAQNIDPNVASGKPGLAPTNAMPKRALGDITNFISVQQDAHQQYKPVAAAKIRRATSTKVAKVVSSNSAAARRARASALMAATKKTASPMSTSSVPSRRASGRLAKRAATAAVVQCKLDFAAASMDECESVLASDDLFESVQLPPGVIDIDEGDYEDELSNALYAKDVFINFCKAEPKFMTDPDYMCRQQDITIKMRAILVDWLVDVHQKFKLLPETLHLTVSIIDRFLAVKPVLRKKLQLVGVTAMFIASKYQEIYAPEVADFVYISDKAYEKEEILAMEAVILNDLKFEVTVPSSLTFLQRCLKAARADSGCDLDGYKHVAQYLVELALQDSAMLRYRPSLRAASAVNLAAKLWCLPLMWSPTMIFCSGGWTAEDISECEVEMLRLLEHERDIAGTNKLTAVKRKFGVSKYSCVSSAMCQELSNAQPTSMDICPAE